MAALGRLETVLGALDRLSTREKYMVGGLGAALLLTLVFMLWFVIGRQIDELEERNQAMKDNIARIRVLQPKYLSEKTKIEAAEKRLVDNKVKLVRLMEDQARRQGITIEDFKENRRPLTENYRNTRRGEDEGTKKEKVLDLVEDSQTVRIRKVTVEQLAKFMAALESRREPVKVTRLQTTTLPSDRQLLREVRMTVATYRKAEMEP